MTQWLDEEGAMLENVAVGHFENHFYGLPHLRGILTKNAIEAGEELISLPSSLAMSAFSARSSTQAAFLEEQVPR